MCQRLVLFSSFLFYIERPVRACRCTVPERALPARSVSSGCGGRGGKSPANSRATITHTTPVSDCKGLANFLSLDELLRLWEPHKWVPRLIWVYEYIYGSPLIIIPAS